MAATLNFFDTYSMIAVTEEIVPKASFFRDRYFPTSDDDIFASDKVLTEYQKGDRKMAAFVAPRAGDIAVERRGYEIHEYQPAYIGLSRNLTLDDLTKRGFGEALYPGSNAAQRAARLQLRDFSELDARIRRREEWMAAQTMINNGCDMQEYVDAKTKGDMLRVRYYDETSEHTYAVAAKWDTSSSRFRFDVRAMCQMLSRRGLSAADLILGGDAADCVTEDAKVRELLDKNLAIEFGSMNESIEYPGVVRMGSLNFGGFKLNLFDVTESYVDDDNSEKLYFPKTSAMVTAPGCGRFMYGQITQIDYGQVDYTTYARARVPKFFVDQNKDQRGIRLATRPLAAPKNYCPYIYAANVVG